MPKAHRFEHRAAALRLASLGLVAACQVPLVVRQEDDITGASGVAGVPTNQTEGGRDTGGEPSGGGTRAGDAGNPSSGNEAGQGPTEAGASGQGGASPLGDCEHRLSAWSVGAGEHHVCASEYSTSKLYCWGFGESGQLGNGDTQSVPVPTLVMSKEPFGKVKVGTVSSCAVTHSGDLMCFGDNFDGVLADGTTQGTSVPVLTATNVSDFSMSAGYVLVRTPKGLFAWGSNTHGQLGLGSDSVGTAVRSVSLVTTADWIGLSAGYSHACLFEYSTRAAFCAGNNQSSRLGLPGMARSTFTQLDIPELAYFSAGYDRTCAVTIGAQLLCWGNNEPVTFAGKPPEIASPQLLGTRTDWQYVSVGFDHFCATTTTGRLFCAGDNSDGELGYIGSASTELIEPLPDLRFNWASAGRNFTCATTVLENDVVCWGSNEHGKLGRGSSPDEPGLPEYVCLPP